MNKTGIVRHGKYLDHDMGPYHPESPKRLEAIYAMLDEKEMSEGFIEVPVRRATDEELALVHTRSYIDTIAETEGKASTYLDADTQTCESSYEASLLAVGGLCNAISMVHSGELDNAFALVRPPGHHAENNRAMGFCLFNNVAVGARYAQESLGMEKVLIIDWDLHHGNGTQHSFEEDPSILYFSTHQYPYYPGTGAFSETGVGKGRGFTVNVPLPVGCGDIEYVNIYEKIFKPMAEEFDPDLVLVSAGFDIYKEDPLGGMRVTPDGFAALARSIMGIADKCCKGNMVITLEGGYNVEGQRDSVKEVLKELSGMSETDLSIFINSAEPQMLESLIGKLKETHDSPLGNVL